MAHPGGVPGQLATIPDTEQQQGNHLNTNGPHSGDCSREVTEAVAEGVRVLNHASTGSASGLDYASDVDSILRNLQSAACGLRQQLH